MRVEGFDHSPMAAAHAAARDAASGSACIPPYVTKFAPHLALKLIACGMLTFDERVELHCVATRARVVPGCFLVLIGRDQRHFWGAVWKGPAKFAGDRCRARGEQLMFFKNFARKWLKSRPKSGLDCRVCARFARQRSGRD